MCPDRTVTFDFLGFTHICGITRGKGWFQLRRVTMAKRMHAKLAEIKQQFCLRLHRRMREVGAWLRKFCRGSTTTVRARQSAPIVVNAISVVAPVVAHPRPQQSATHVVGPLLFACSDVVARTPSAPSLSLRALWHHPLEVGTVCG